MKKYEITYIIHPDLEGSTSKVIEKIKGTIEKSGGKVLNEENWGKKRLAYPISKNQFGIYTFLVIEIEPDKIRELSRLLKLSEEIIRSLVVKVEEKESVAKTDIKKAKLVEKSQKETKEKKTKETNKTKAENEKEIKERQKELDAKLQEIIGPDKES